jgi:cytidylate kinase
MSFPVLTIDGPSGAGKGTVSRAVAKKLGWNYLDSGAIYRALAIAILDQGASMDNVNEITKAAKRMQLTFQCNEELAVLLDGDDISSRLASEEIGSVASKIAALPEVRKVLLQKQRDFQQQPGLVADGRDMGTVVFADAPYKVFLTADAATRAKRRYKQLIEKGIDANLTRIIKDIEERDRRDSERSVAPLEIATNAHYIDSSEKSIVEVITEVLDLID